MAGKITDGAERLLGPGQLTVLDEEWLGKGFVGELLGRELNDSPSERVTGYLVPETEDPQVTGTERFHHRLQVELGERGRQATEPGTAGQRLDIHRCDRVLVLRQRTNRKEVAVNTDGARGKAGIIGRRVCEGSEDMKALTGQAH
jgi:hypothetical protein